MHQAIPYRSWRPHHHHNSTTNFTPHPLITHSHITIATNNTTTNNDDHHHEDDKNNTHSSFAASSSSSINNSISSMVPKMVSENAVIVFGRKGCCMSHVVKRLLLGLGVNPAVHEIEEKDEVDVVKELEAIRGDNNGELLLQFPVVFIGGNLFGGLERLMATHISGELIPLLKEAGALWL